MVYPFSLKNFQRGVVSAIGTSGHRIYANWLISEGNLVPMFYFERAITYQVCRWQSTFSKGDTGVQTIKGQLYVIACA